MKKSELNKLLRYWQKRLRLQDWDITVSLFRNFSSTSISNCIAHYQTKSCLIKIDLDTGKDYSGRKYTIEELLVHELLEIYFINISKSDKETEKDMAINMITDALMYEKYKNQ